MKTSSRLFCIDCNTELRRLGTVNGKPRLESRCSQCASKANRIWLNKNPGYLAKKYAQARAVYRKRALLKLYNLTEEQWQEMSDAQGGVCAICKKHQRYRKLCTDHNHKTGKVRGLLCNRCNRLLGYVFDSSTYLRNAADYLDRTNK